MRGIILVNVGTPASDGKNDVKQFIGDMLSDPLVTGKPEWRSKLLARNIIAPLSASKSSEKYKLIWRKEEPITSPLQYYTRQLALALEKSKEIAVEVAMRYGEPSFTTALKELERKCPQLQEVIIFPLFPHYAQSTTQTAIEEMGRVFFKQPRSYQLKFVEPYYNHPAYIKALAISASPYIDDIDKLLFSYHSLPVIQVEAGWNKRKKYDYVYQVKETNRLLCEALGIDLQRTQLFFSSQRDDHWIKPYLDTDIDKLPEQGVKKVAVMAPGFPIDNMETLFDMDYEARKFFMEAGGDKFTFIPSLNDHEAWVEAIWKIILQP